MISQLTTIAEEIKNATQPNANTAQKVGGLLEEITKYLSSFKVIVGKLSVLARSGSQGEIFAWENILNETESGTITAVYVDDSTVNLTFGNEINAIAVFDQVFFNNNNYSVHYEPTLITNSLITAKVTQQHATNKDPLSEDTDILIFILVSNP